MQSKEEESHETQAIVQDLKTSQRDEEDWSSGIQADLGKYEKAVE